MYIHIYIYIYMYMYTDQNNTDSSNIKHINSNGNRQVININSN